MTGHKTFSWVMVGILILAGGTAAAEDETVTPSAAVGQWLVLGPVTVPLPAFDEEDRSARLQGLLEKDMLHRGLELPVAGEPVSWFGSEKSWRAVNADSEGVVPLSAPEAIGDDTGAVTWLVTSLAARRFTTLGLEIESEHLTTVTLDGGEIELKDGTEIELEPGSHTVVIKTVFNPEIEKPWSVSTEINNSIRTCGLEPPDGRSRTSKNWGPLSSIM